ncbi:DUF3889 domain-containing protein [Niallia taxi]|uniref:DUF3889 domain-containing protein n=1 Tax=Niallia taxi TaxID=2499688 RepID=UPI0015F37AB8|nr:DUF3889 domain-containing protein [Niallia taxi]MCM3216196.1 YqzG/YhdC family protein [Niallia taxi]MDK8643034.1 DUF3889 domain-containing protein [Niallia taxi]MED4037099.1 DUF3889 domain-containing protein [Niallia taxi]MED4053093.1 DUF3889 domain-containing protein [Niallia taxi]MED4118933.1 DUF3889 domain-containing protein [Niallia taxi]
MKNRAFPILVASILIMAFLFPSHNIAVQKSDYEKYGSIAIAVVKADYPDQAVTDYKYMGRKKITTMEVEDSFQFVVKENSKEKTVEVIIKHDLENDKFISLTVSEPEQP